MIIFKTPVILLMLALLIGLHIASLLVSEKLGKILTYVNIGLHILLLPLLLIQKFTIEEGVLTYMISIFAYTLASYIVYKVREGTPSTTEWSPSLEREANGTPSTADTPSTTEWSPSPKEEANDTPSTAETFSPEEKANETLEGGVDK